MPAPGGPLGGVSALRRGQPDHAAAPRASTCARPNAPASAGSSKSCSAASQAAVSALLRRRFANGSAIEFVSSGRGMLAPTAARVGPGMPGPIEDQFDRQTGAMNAGERPQYGRARRTLLSPLRRRDGPNADDAATRSPAMSSRHRPPAPAACAGLRTIPGIPAPPCRSDDQYRQASLMCPGSSEISPMVFSNRARGDVRPSRNWPAREPQEARLHIGRAAGAHQTTPDGTGRRTAWGAGIPGMVRRPAHAAGAGGLCRLLTGRRTRGGIVRVRCQSRLRSGDSSVRRRRPYCGRSPAFIAPRLPVEWSLIGPGMPGPYTAPL